MTNTEVQAEFGLAKSNADATIVLHHMVELTVLLAAIRRQFPDNALCLEHEEDGVLWVVIHTARSVLDVMEAIDRVEDDVSRCNTHRVMNLRPQFVSSPTKMDLVLGRLFAHRTHDIALRRAHVETSAVAVTMARVWCHHLFSQWSLDLTDWYVDHQCFVHLRYIVAGVDFRLVFPHRESKTPKVMTVVSHVYGPDIWSPSTYRTFAKAVRRTKGM